MALSSLGFTAALAQVFESLTAEVEVPVEPARVVRQDGLLRVRTATVEALAVASGKLSARAASAEGLPVVGDWVAVTTGGADDVRHVVAIVPRTSLLSRRMPGEAERPQPMAANVDTVLVVLGLDAPLNERRLERSLTWVLNSGAVPAVVLNKRDACANLEALVARVRELAPGVEVVTCSARMSEGLEEVRALLTAGRTAMLLGPSGVGKSSLVNALLGEEALRTHEVRASDGKGRHTTTHRELRELPGGALLVDVPGVRELGLWADGEGLEEAFEEIAQLAAQCRFADCQHQAEPGCAVQGAVRAGALEEERLESFQKLRRELARVEAKSDVRAALERKKHDKTLGVAGWTHSRDKRKR